MFMLLDSETTIQNHVADLGIIICDRKGTIHKTLSVLVSDFWEKEDLFHDISNSIWGRKNLNTRVDNYKSMLADGRRMLASVASVNRWLAKAATEYKKPPILTAYNLVFDTDKCNKSGIILDGFDRRFCLWHTAAAKYAHTREYQQFILDAHAFNPPTRLGNMTYQTSAEIMTRFVMKNHSLEDEPHTAMEDVIGYELPILVDLAGRKKMTVDELLNGAQRRGYNWRDYQVRDHYRPK